MGKSLYSQLRGIKAKYQNYAIQLLQREDLDEIAVWPQYNDPLFSWANLPATTPQLRERWMRGQSKEYLVWLVIRNPDYNNPKTQIICRCSITQPLVGGEFLFGIVMRPDLVEKGIGSMCTRLALSLVFHQTNIESIWLETKINNSRARRVWEKVGFELHGTHYRRELNGRYDQYVGYRISKAAFSPLPLDIKKSV
ncbi:MAG: GNAT family N-acetyltransferase [Candidatus Kariarchaeaceae archaeon]|jgi:RimJ/RimL family protein N-acetyltransferase